MRPGQDHIARAPGSFSARMGRRSTREGSDYRRRREAALLATTDAGQGEHLLSPTQETYRAAIDAQLCPVCGAGPYKVLSGHTHKAHGIDRHELRRLAGLPAKASVCSRETSERQRENLAGRPDREEITQKGNAASVRREAWRKAAAAQKVLHVQRTALRDALIMRLYHQGALIRDIAREAGISARHVRLIVKDNGIDAEDGRARRMRDPDERRKLQRQLDQGRAAQQAVALAENAQLAAEFASRGGTPAAAQAMAAAAGISRKGMRARLVECGCQVPDARIAANQKRRRLSDADRQAICDLYRAGMTQSDLGRRFGVGQPRISAVLRQDGVPTRAFARASRNERNR